MFGALNFEDMGRKSKKQIRQEEIKETKIINIPKQNYNFNKLITSPRGQRNMGMHIKFKKGENIISDEEFF